MAWFLNLLGSIAGSAITGAGEKVGDHLIPNERLKDTWQTARRLKGDMADLYNLYARLNKYTDQTEETCKDVCYSAIHHHTLFFC